jgi:hypothetical protein
VPADDDYAPAWRIVLIAFRQVLPLTL